jgi:hypothetical protein
MPKSSKQTTTPEPSLQQLFDNRQTSLWEEGVSCLCKERKLDKYILDLEESERVAEFSALVNYLGPKGEFRHHEYGFVNAVKRADSRYRRSEAEAILTRENSQLLSDQGDQEGEEDSETEG